MFPYVSHGVCTYHLKQNLKTRFKSLEGLKLFNDAACTYHLVEFNVIFGQLQMISLRATTYLVNASVDRWARSHFSRSRYNIMTTGVAESLNVVLKDARDLPILWLIEELRNLLQKWFANRKQQTLSMTNELTTWAEGELRMRYNTSSTYEVEEINLMEYNVKYNGVSDHVNLHTHSCTCRHSDLDHKPCSHAIVACRYAQMSCYSLCSKYYNMNTFLASYIKSIYPPRHRKDWVVLNNIRSRVLLPLKTRRPAGRLRKERILSGGEGKCTRRCGRFGDYGHNWKSCK